MFRVLSFLILGLACLGGAFFLLLKKDKEESALPKYSLEARKKFSNLKSIVVDDFIWLLTKDSTLLKLDENANILSEIKVPFEKISTTFLIENNVLYAVSGSRKIFAYDLNGNVLWEFDSTKKILAELVIDKDLIIFGSYDSKMYALDKKAGNIVFEYESSEAINDKVVLDNSKIYFGDCAGILTSLDINTKETMSQDISEHLPTAPIIAGDFLIVLDYENTIFCLDKISLEIIWEMPSEAKSLEKIDNKIYALSDNLYVLDIEEEALSMHLSLIEKALRVEKLNPQSLVIITKQATMYIYEENKLAYSYNFGVDLCDIKTKSNKIFIMDNDNNIYIFKANE